MGLEQILRTAVGVTAFLGLSLGSVASADSAKSDAPRATHERIAIVDLGPNAADATVRQKLAQAAVAAGLSPASEDGIQDALAGQTMDLDAIDLAAAVDRATKAFAALDCKAAVAAAGDAIGLAAARQAGGDAVPELSRAYAYELLCADRANQTDAAMQAASRLRVVGAPPDIAPLLSKYPELDTTGERDLVEVEVSADVPDAMIWVDHKRIGKAPVKIELGAGPHLLAAAAGSRRGFATGTAVPSQPNVTIPTKDEAVQWTKLSDRIASWHGAVPPVFELAEAMTQAHARVLLIRHGDVLEAWGRIGAKDEPHRLGTDEGVLGLADTTRVMALISDRAHTWNDHAPDPDQPLLVETKEERAALRAGGKRDEPTKWWVYASIIGAVAAVALVVYLNDEATDTQRVELHFP